MSVFHHSLFYLAYLRDFNKAPCTHSNVDSLAREYISFVFHFSCNFVRNNDDTKFIHEHGTDYYAASLTITIDNPPSSMRLTSSSTRW